jgi:hypothetical protein
MLRLSARRVYRHKQPSAPPGLQRGRSRKIRNGWKRALRLRKHETVSQLWVDSVEEVVAKKRPDVVRRVRCFGIQGAIP